MSTVLAIIMVFGGLYALYWLRRWDREDTSGVVYPDRNTSTKKYDWKWHVRYNSMFSFMPCNVWNGFDDDL
jgi:hypothetical protein